MEKDYDALFAAHHRRLIGSIEDLGQRVKEDVLSTPELLTYLGESLVPHAQGEEATLYKQAATLPGGTPLIQSMIGEHQEIVQHIHDLGRLFATQQDAELQSPLSSLLRLIHTHFQKEEEVLTPLLREHLTRDEFGRLIEAAHKVEHDVKPSDIKRFMDIDHRRVDRMLETFSTLTRSDLNTAIALFACGRAGLLIFGGKRNCFSPRSRRRRICTAAVQQW